MAHQHNLSGHLNSMDIVKTTNLYFKIIMNKLTPALPKLAKPLQERIGREITAMFPTDTEDWIAIEPLDKFVYWISSAFSFIAVRSPLCDDPDHIRLMSEQSELGKLFYPS